MGVLISRFRKKKNSEDLLEELTKKIEKIEKCQESEQDKLKIRNQQFLVYSIIIYVLLVCSYFIFQLYSNNYITMSLLVIPLSIYLLRKGLIYYYKRRLIKNKTKIESFKKEKQKILNDVMETETYKVAKRILEKYDSNNYNKFIQPKISTPIPIPRGTPLNTPVQNSILQSDLRKRTSRDVFFHNKNMLVSANKPQPTLVRPIIHQNRGVLDRIFQKVIGDGPNERYALICKGCGSHNGMALKEEFEYLSYRCAFCSFYNPARKQRPVLSNTLAIEGRQSSDSEDTSLENTVEIKEIFDSEDEKDSKKTSGDIVDKVISSKIVDQIEKIVENSTNKSEITNNSTSETHVESNLENHLTKDKSNEFNMGNNLVEDKPDVELFNIEKNSTGNKSNVELNIVDHNSTDDKPNLKLNLENDLTRDKPNVELNIEKNSTGSKFNVELNIEKDSTGGKLRIESSRKHVDKQSQILEETDFNIEKNSEEFENEISIKNELTEKLNTNNQDVFIANNNNQSDFLGNDKEHLSSQPQMSEDSESSQPVFSMETDENSVVESVLTNRVSQLSINS